MLQALLVEKTDNKQTNAIMSVGRRWRRKNQRKQQRKTKKEKVTGEGDRPV